MGKFKEVKIPCVNKDQLYLTITEDGDIEVYMRYMIDDMEDFKNMTVLCKAEEFKKALETLGLTVKEKEEGKSYQRCKYPDMPYDGCKCLDVDGDCLSEQFYVGGGCVFDEKPKEKEDIK